MDVNLYYKIKVRAIDYQNINLNEKKIFWRCN